MNKIKQNKITFTLILVAIFVIFSSLAILSLPVLFNYKSKVVKIEKNFYKNFKIYLKSKGKISFKPFPKPHLLVENASLSLSNSTEKNDLIKNTNLRIFISLKDIYLRSFENLISTKISDTNIDLELSDIKKFREHLYQKVNKPIVIKNCKIFFRNKLNEVILISPISKISYKISTKNKIKHFILRGEVFGLNFKSEWKRKYEVPKSSFHNIKIFDPNIEIKNIYEFKNINQFKNNTKIKYLNNKIEYNMNFNNNKIFISSPNDENINFNLNSEVNLKPFYLEGILNIKNIKAEKIIDNLLLNLIIYNEKYLGNLNGKLILKFDNLDNILIKNGKLEMTISEKKINLKEIEFKLSKIGNIKSNINFVDDQGDIKFISKNELNIENHIEFAKTFQVGSKKIKHIKKIYFDLEKNIGETDLSISNVQINKNKNIMNPDTIFLVKNIQNLRSHIRKIID